MEQSYFDGKLLGLIGTNILVFLVTLFTLGFGVPWAITIKQRWLTKYTVIEGRRLVFKGTGASLFGQGVKWLLLTIITLGIYGFWVSIKMQQWVTKNTSFAEN